MCNRPAARQYSLIRASLPRIRESIYVYKKGRDMDTRSIARESYEELIKDIEHSQAGSETWENARIKIQVKLVQDLVLTISSELNKGFEI
jgi:hypothetical protein